MTQNFTKAELFQEAKWRQYQRDPIAFFSECWRIQHPEHGAILFDLFDAQRRALAVFMDERYVITLKARQIGWTTLVSAYAFWLAFFHPDRLVIFLSKGEREAAEILKKVKYGFIRLPEWMRARGPKPGRDNLTALEFDNGSSIESLPSKSDPARGRSCYLVVVDEWAFLENGEEAWGSIEPIADVGGRVIGLSTANGIGNFFYELWQSASVGAAPGSRFTTIFEPWSARDDRDENWYASKAQSMPDWLLHQEYPRTPDEAFIKSGNPFFDVEKLSTLEIVKGRPGHIISDRPRVFAEGREGPLELWQLPFYGEKYVIGADVAEGLEWGDFSSAHVKRLRTGEVVAHWHGHIPPDEFAETLCDLGWFYGRALIGVENNNHGLTTCTVLKSLGYPNIFYTRTVDERTRRMTQKIGWSTNKKTRPIMLDDLYAALRDDAIVVYDKETIHELRSFIRDEHGRLHGSPFDDRVMSLAITEQMASYAHQDEYAEQFMEWGTLAWWQEQLDGGEPERTPIGAHNVRANGTSGRIQ